LHAEVREKVEGREVLQAGDRLSPGISTLIVQQTPPTVFSCVYPFSAETFSWA
jgi:hypothetical protein